MLTRFRRLNGSLAIATEISDDLIKQAGQAIETSAAVVFVLADQANTAVIAKLIDEAAAGGAKVEYQVLSEDAQDLLRMHSRPGARSVWVCRSITRA